LPPEIATEPVSGNSWAVLGGGFLGMTLALRLAQQGKDVTLIESATHLGGLASAWRLGDVTWDRHYHVTLLSDSYLRGLLRELRLEDEITWVQTKTGFFTDSCLHSMSNSLDFLRFPPLTLVDKFRLAMNIIYASRLKDWKSLENISATDWLLKWSGAHTFQKIWLPLLRSKLGENSEKASAAFIWAIIARMYAARHAGMKREMFGYVQGGYARVLENMERRLVEEGVKLELGKPVRQVENTDGGLTVHFGGERRTFERGSRSTQRNRISRDHLCLLAPEEAIGRLLRHEYHRPLGALHCRDRDDSFGRQKAVRGQSFGVSAQVCAGRFARLCHSRWNHSK
jgi:protoporphyrinogen oxidase